MTMTFRLQLNDAFMTPALLVIIQVLGQSNILGLCHQIRFLLERYSFRPNHRHYNRASPLVRQFLDDGYGRIRPHPNLGVSLH